MPKILGVMEPKEKGRCWALVAAKNGLARNCANKARPGQCTCIWHEPFEQAALAVDAAVRGILDGIMYGPAAHGTTIGVTLKSGVAIMVEELPKYLPVDKKISPEHQAQKED